MLNRGALIFAAAFTTLSSFHSPLFVNGHGYLKVRRYCSDAICDYTIPPNYIVIYLSFSSHLFTYRPLTAALLLFISIKLHRPPDRVTITPTTTSSLLTNAPARLAVLRQNTVLIA
jgi:hypothetical protein